MAAIFSPVMPGAVVCPAPADEDCGGRALLVEDGMLQSTHKKQTRGGA
jgi:hypothetical protein